MQVQLKKLSYEILIDFIKKKYQIRIDITAVLSKALNFKLTFHIKALISKLTDAYFAGLTFCLQLQSHMLFKIHISKHLFHV